MVDFTQDDGPVAFILLARVSPGERVHDIKNMVSAVHHGDTMDGLRLEPSERRGCLGHRGPLKTAEWDLIFVKEVWP